MSRGCGVYSGNSSSSIGGAVAAAIPGEGSSSRRHIGTAAGAGDRENRRPNVSTATATARGRTGAAATAAGGDLICVGVGCRYFCSRDEWLRMESRLIPLPSSSSCYDKGRRRRKEDEDEEETKEKTRKGSGRSEDEQEEIFVDRYDVRLLLSDVNVFVKKRKHKDYTQEELDELLDESDALDRERYRDLPQSNLFEEEILDRLRGHSATDDWTPTRELQQQLQQQHMQQQQYTQRRLLSRREATRKIRGEEEDGSIDWSKNAQEEASRGGGGAGSVITRQRIHRRRPSEEPAAATTSTRPLGDLSAVPPPAALDTPAERLYSSSHSGDSNHERESRRSRYRDSSQYTSTLYEKSSRSRQPRNSSSSKSDIEKQQLRDSEGGSGRGYYDAGVTAEEIGRNSSERYKEDIDSLRSESSNRDDVSRDRNDEVKEISRGRSLTRTKRRETKGEEDDGCDKRLQQRQLLITRGDRGSCARGGGEEDEEWKQQDRNADSYSRREGSGGHSGKDHSNSRGRSRSRYRESSTRTYSYASDDERRKRRRDNSSSSSSKSRSSSNGSRDNYQIRNNRKSRSVGRESLSTNSNSSSRRENVYEDKIIDSSNGKREMIECGSRKEHSSSSSVSRSTRESKRYPEEEEKIASSNSSSSSRGEESSSTSKTDEGTNRSTYEASGRHREGHEKEEEEWRERRKKRRSVSNDRETRFLYAGSSSETEDASWKKNTFTSNSNSSSSNSSSNYLCSNRRESRSYVSEDISQVDGMVPAADSKGMRRRDQEDDKKEKEDKCNRSTTATVRETVSDSQKGGMSNEQQENRIQMKDMNVLEVPAAAVSEKRKKKFDRTGVTGADATVLARQDKVVEEEEERASLEGRDRVEKEEEKEEEKRGREEGHLQGNLVRKHFPNIYPYSTRDPVASVEGTEILSSRKEEEEVIDEEEEEEKHKSEKKSYSSSSTSTSNDRRLYNGGNEENDKEEEEREEDGEGKQKGKEEKEGLRKEFAEETLSYHRCINEMREDDLPIQGDETESSASSNNCKSTAKAAYQEEEEEKEKERHQKERERGKQGKAEEKEEKEEEDEEDADEDEEDEKEEDEEERQEDKEENNRGAFFPPFHLPKQLHLPKTLKEHLIIERTAHFVRTEGSRMEFRLKLEAATSCRLPFLHVEHPLHAYYAYIRDTGDALSPHRPELLPPKVLLLCKLVYTNIAASAQKKQQQQEEQQQQEGRERCREQQQQQQNEKKMTSKQQQQEDQQQQHQKKQQQEKDLPNSGREENSLSKKKKKTNGEKLGEEEDEEEEEEGEEQSCKERAGEDRSISLNSAARRNAIDRIEEGDNADTTSREVHTKQREVLSPSDKRYIISTADESPNAVSTQQQQDPDSSNNGKMRSSSSPSKLYIKDRENIKSNIIIRAATGTPVGTGKDDNDNDNNNDNDDDNDDDNDVHNSLSVTSSGERIAAESSTTTTATANSKKGNIERKAHPSTASTLVSSSTGKPAAVAASSTTATATASVAAASAAAASASSSKTSEDDDGGGLSMLLSYGSVDDSEEDKEEEDEEGGDRTAVSSSVSASVNEGVNNASVENTISVKQEEESVVGGIDQHLQQQENNNKKVAGGTTIRRGVERGGSKSVRRGLNISNEAGCDDDVMREMKEENNREGKGGIERKRERSTSEEGVEHSRHIANSGIRENLLHKKRYVDSEMKSESISQHIKVKDKDHSKIKEESMTSVSKTTGKKGDSSSSSSSSSSASSSSSSSSSSLLERTAEERAAASRRLEERRADLRKKLREYMRRRALYLQGEKGEILLGRNTSGDDHHHNNIEEVQKAASGLEQESHSSSRSKKSSMNKGTEKHMINEEDISEAGGDDKILKKKRRGSADTSAEAVTLIMMKKIGDEKGYTEEGIEHTHREYEKEAKEAKEEEKDDEEEDHELHALWQSGKSLRVGFTLSQPKPAGQKIDISAEVAAAAAGSTTPTAIAQDSDATAVEEALNEIPTLCWAKPNEKLGLSQLSALVIQQIGCWLLCNGSSDLVEFALQQTETSEETIYSFLRRTTIDSRYYKYVLQCVLRHKKEKRPMKRIQLTSWHSLTRSFVARLKFEFHLFQKQKKHLPQNADAVQCETLTQELINENAAATAAAAAAAARAAEEAAETEAVALAAEAPRLGLRLLLPVVKQNKSEASAGDSLMTPESDAAGTESMSSTDAAGVVHSGSFDVPTGEAKPSEGLQSTTQAGVEGTINEEISAEAAANIRGTDGPAGASIPAPNTDAAGMPVTAPATSSGIDPAAIIAAAVADPSSVPAAVSQLTTEMYAAYAAGNAPRYAAFYAAYYQLYSYANAGLLGFGICVPPVATSTSSAAVEEATETSVSTTAPPDPTGSVPRAETRPHSANMADAGYNAAGIR